MSRARGKAKGRKRDGDRKAGRSDGRGLARGDESGRRSRRDDGGRRGARRDEESRRVVVGRRFVQEALVAGTIDKLFLTSRVAESMPELLEAAEQAGVPVKQSEMATLDKMTDGIRHQGVVGEGPPYAFASLETLLRHEAPLLVALDEISDPQNLGAIVRSALAFGADGVLVPKHRSARITATVVRASAGATERAAIAQVTNLQRALTSLAEHGLEIIGLAADGEVSVGDLGVAPRGRVIVVGSEGAGLRRLVRARCDRLAAIPQLREFDSLNASVAAAIALYEAAATRPSSDPLPSVPQSAKDASS